MTIVEKQLRHFTVEEYYKMAEGGVFHPDERVELLGGEVRYMSPVNANHIITVRRLNQILSRIFGDVYDIDIQSPLALTEDSEPEPDAMVIRAYQEGEEPYKPTPKDVFIVVEVSDTTLRYDGGEKLKFYAFAEIPEYWIVDLNNGVITQHLEPDVETGRYRISKRWRKGDMIPTHLGKEVPVNNILI
jgi:Uma2 family endonuclease